MAETLITVEHAGRTYRIDRRSVVDPNVLLDDLVGVRCQVCRRVWNTHAVGNLTCPECHQTSTPGWRQVFRNGELEPALVGPPHGFTPAELAARTHVHRFDKFDARLKHYFCGCGFRCTEADYQAMTGRSLFR